MKRKLLSLLLHRSPLAERSQKLQRRILRFSMADSVLALKRIQRLVVNLALGSQRRALLPLHLMLFPLSQ